MKKVIIFNWKMAPQSLKEAQHLFADYLKLLKIKNYKNYKLKANIIITLPFVYLEPLLRLLKLKTKHLKLKLASQDVFWAAGGAYTGEISPTMIKNLGVEYAIIGHSERRRILGETDEMVNKKVLAALKAGLKVVLCVGEPKRSIKNQVSSIKIAKNYIKRQLLKDLKGVLNLKSEILNLIVAYEPIWAIGTGKPCRPQDALEMIKFIKNILDSKFQISDSLVLYGGSVNSKNIKNFVKLKEVDGVLVGGASLNSKEVKKIIKICQTIT